MQRPATPPPPDGERYDVREERRSRKQLSCAECHRLKLKCDRQVPCSNCVRRECTELCPNSVRVKKPTPQRTESDSVVSDMRERLAAIEGMLANIPGLQRSRRRSRSRSGSSSTSGSRSRDRDRDRYRDRDRERERERSEYRRARDREGERSLGRDSSRDRPRERDKRREREQPQDPWREMEEPQRFWDRGGERSDLGRRSRSPSTRFRHSPYAAQSPCDVREREPGHRDSLRDTTTVVREGFTPRAEATPSARAPTTPSMSGTAATPARFTFAYEPPAQQVNDESYGTLVIDRSGRSKWLGPTAGTEWLKNQELSPSSNPRRSRSRSAQSPEPARDFGFGAESLFPFPSWGPPPTMETIMFHLPPPEQAGVLVDAYYRNYTWNHDVAPRSCLQPIFDRAYGLGDEEVTERRRERRGEREIVHRVHPQQLALLFIILAMGALHNPDLPPHDPSAEHHLAAARWCLVKGDFIGNNTIAGLQALVIMAHYHLETEKGRNGDSAWPLWGLAMRLVTAMGLHVDGKRWNLPPEVAEERRHVFWECHTIDVFQANCFSRPSSLRPEHIDTEFPGQNWEGGSALKSFRTLKFELCRISGAVLDQAMDVRPTPYMSIEALYDRLCAFERHIPFHLRCRTALLALPSVYADAESATRDSPEVNRTNLHRTFQQFTLALNVSESILFLQRPYFVRALQEAPQDPTRSAYAKSYLAVVERCNVLVEVVGGLYELYPTVTARHWFFWYHLFTAAVCLGTMIILNPTNPLAGLVLGQIDHSIKLYSSVLRDHATPSLVQNHQWLLRLRARALSKVEHAPPPPGDGEDVDVELLGWRTRLVERARGTHRATTISGRGRRVEGEGEGEATAPDSAAVSPPVTAPPPLGMPLGMAPAPTIDQVLQQHFVAADSLLGPLQGAGDRGGAQADPSTDLFLHQFWDPTTLLESREGGAAQTGANWWNNWDLGIGDLQSNPM